MSAIRVLLVAVVCLAVTVECAPFFDAIYDAINGNTRRSYGYSGYGNYGYDGYGGYAGGYQNPSYGYRPRNVERAPRQGKTFKEICRVHYPDSCAPFFDAIYDAINGNTRRSYGYSGYGNYGYDGYGGYAGGYQNPSYGYRPRNVERAPRQGKTFKEICRVHYPDSVAMPGAGGILCPY
uniref:Uncharacterized protein n=1 Tax=Heliothis virescens TaxID=7102 RepID=A0A2A4IVC6_HELVI